MGSKVKDRQRGLTIIEILIAMVVIVIGLVGLMTSLLQSMKLDSVSSENVLALNAARAKIEEMRSTPNFNEIYALYNIDSSDDPAGPGTGPGASFNIAGLSAPEGSPSGFPGRIEFPENASGVAGLFEDFEDEGLGMPRDLNGDGFIDSLSHDSDYVLLPVRIVIEWQAISGTVTSSYVTFLAPR